ncbi:H-NS histone family protein [Pseudoxanthomonas kaohsiungensis]|uniref:H-NS family nucleoid-associated regulatory protein n=1 Tax=Pseudoxanthomonas kaohsiungensis TaxID=283923 RepID=A0ABW3LZ90_9GAMM|nr:H-NS histone family protein [Pseudoxanthomonas kaohsiungensis]KAF1702864.1 DNA-binding protein [Pseudoxanthomonas kaohsiungensis]
MPAYDAELSNLTYVELARLIRRAEKRKAELLQRKPASQVRAIIVIEAAQAGYTMEELFGIATADAVAGPKRRRRRKAKARTKLPAKYRNPENPDETWTGRGSMPRWLSALTKRGRSRADFLVPGVAKPTPTKHKPDGKRRVVKAAR